MGTGGRRKSASSSGGPVAGTGGWQQSVSCSGGRVASTGGWQESTKDQLWVRTVWRVSSDGGSDIIRHQRIFGTDHYLSLFLFSSLQLLPCGTYRTSLQVSRGGSRQFCALGKNYPGPFSSCICFMWGLTAGGSDAVCSALPSWLETSLSQIG